MVGTILLILMCVIIYVDTTKNDSIFSKYSTDLYKGIGAILVFIHHIANITDGGLLNYMNYPSVSIFFLSAGYGLMLSYLNKKEYIKILLSRKIPIIILWSLFSIFTAYLFNCIIREQPSIKEVLFCFTGNRLLNWFFTAIIIHYFLFIIATRISNNDKQLPGMVLVLTILYMVCARLIIQRTSWYASSLAFPTGIFLAYLNKQKVICLIRKKIYVVVGSIIFILTLGISILNDDCTALQRLMRLAAQIISAESFAIVVLILCCQRKSRKILSWCGKHSAQILFVQNISLYVFHNNYIRINNHYLYAILTIGVEALLLIIFDPCYLFLKKKVSA